MPGSLGFSTKFFLYAGLESRCTRFDCPAELIPEGWGDEVCPASRDQHIR
jgi:hypothetical protein